MNLKLGTKIKWPSEKWNKRIIYHWDVTWNKIKVKAKAKAKAKAKEKKIVFKGILLPKIRITYERMKMQLEFKSLNSLKILKSST